MSTDPRVNYPSHPAAKMFPLMTGTELHELSDDIRENGLIEPVVTHEKTILDGRNRLQACAMAGVKPRFEEWDGSGGSPTLYVIAKNLHRRQLTIGQRAAIAAEMMPLLKEEAKQRQAVSGLGFYGAKPLPVNSPEVVKGEAREIAAKAVSVSGCTIQRAVEIKKCDPEAFERLKRGESTVNAEFVEVRAESQRHPTPATNGVRKSIRENSHKQRMIGGLSSVEGFCSGLEQLDKDLIRAACTAEELHTWAETARGAAANLRKFARQLEGVENGNS